MQASTIPFVDLSVANMYPNAKKLADSGYRGAFVRVGEGLHSHDPMYIEHVNRLSAAGLRTGGYHVVAPSSGDPAGQALQAQEWMERVPESLLAGKRLPLAIDYEPNVFDKRHIDFLAEYLAALSGAVRVVFYASLRVYSNLKDSGFLDIYQGQWWIAAYPTIHYPSTQSEELRLAILRHQDEYKKGMLNNDRKQWAAALTNLHRDSIALSFRGEIPKPEWNIMLPPNTVAWQWGGNANASTCPGAVGLMDQSYFYGWTAGQDGAPEKDWEEWGV
jgi:hypothetical protein